MQPPPITTPSKLWKKKCLKRLQKFGYFQILFIMLTGNCISKHEGVNAASKPLYITLYNVWWGNAELFIYFLIAGLNVKSVLFTLPKIKKHPLSLDPQFQ